MKNKINISYQCFDMKAPLLAVHIRKCIAATLAAEGIAVPCEINVMLTDDVGIHGVNLAMREIETRLVEVDRDLLVIPSVAIHMNREVNSGYKYNAQVDLMPLYGSHEAKGSFRQLITN